LDTNEQSDSGELELHHSSNDSNTISEDEEHDYKLDIDEILEEIEQEKR